MVRFRSLAVLRSVAIAGLLASAVLLADARTPQRGFCPLEAACLKARESPLGNVFGIPTSVVGIAAFGGLLALTFARGPKARAALLAAGAAGALAGAGFLAYQAFALGTFCPLCLVADLAGIAAGVLAWRGAANEAAVAAGLDPFVRARTAAVWAVLAVAAGGLPFVVPRGKPVAAWVPLSAPAGGEGSDPAPTGTDGGAEKGIAIVEYLNPFCPHCRATHARLQKVLAAAGVPVRRLRLYTWAGDPAPRWARACVCAQDQNRDGVDRERPFFRELLDAPDESDRSLRAAAKDAGLDPAALFACMASTAPDERLARVHRRVLSAGIVGLPTIDIGRRRLQGEASEAELKEAVDAAIADLRR